MLVGGCSSELSGHRLQGKLKSHSLRAQPRDLQFSRQVLEMFFEEAVWALRPVEPALSLSKGPTAKRQPSPAGLGHRFPHIARAP